MDSRRSREAKQTYRGRQTKTQKLYELKGYPTDILHGLQQVSAAIHLVNELLVEPHLDFHLPDLQATDARENQLHVPLLGHSTGNRADDLPDAILNRISVKRRFERQGCIVERRTWYMSCKDKKERRKYLIYAYS